MITGLSQKNLFRFIITIFYVSITFAQSAKNNLGNEKVCLTAGCKAAANLVQNDINENADPCNNFYDFACGGFIKNSRISKNYLIANHIVSIHEKVLHQIKELLEEDVNLNEPKIFKLVKNYYKACMDEASIENNSLRLLLHYINRLGGWPVLAGNAWDADKFDVFETDYKLRKIGYNPRNFFNVYVFNDLFNTSRNLLHIDAPEAVVKAEYFKRGFWNEIVQAYYHYMIDVAVLLGADRNSASHQMKKVLNFERDLIIATSIPSKTSPFNLRRISDLQKEALFVPWLKYINHMTEPIYHFKDFFAVNLLNSGYLISLQYLLNKTPKKVIANYMIWKAIDASTPYLTHEFREKNSEFKRVVSEKSARSPQQSRWRQCVNMLVGRNQGLTVGASSMYVRKHFNHDTKKDVSQLVSTIIAGFKNVLEESTWLDKASKIVAIRKIELMHHIIGYPNELLNDETIDNYVKNLDLYPDSYLQNFLNLQRFHFDYMLFGLDKLVDQTLWPLFADSTTVNAYYYAPTNIFVVLAAMLQPPLFNPKWPSYAKFGSIGFIVSHEMMHAFDVKRYMFDEVGNFNPWMSTTSKAQYMNRVNCILDQYESFIDTNNGHVNGTLTMNENVSDNGAVKIAYYAYKHWVEKYGEDALLPGLKYTPTQLFWMNLVNFLCSKNTPEHRRDNFKSDVHTPDDFRVLGMITNSPDFAKAFNCPKDSPMNPSKKCEFW